MVYSLGVNDHDQLIVVKCLFFEQPAVIAYPTTPVTKEYRFFCRRFALQHRRLHSCYLRKSKITPDSLFLSMRWSVLPGSGRCRTSWCRKRIQNYRCSALSPWFLPSMLTGSMKKSGVILPHRLMPSCSPLKNICNCPGNSQGLNPGSPAGTFLLPSQR